MGKAWSIAFRKLAVDSGQRASRDAANLGCTPQTALPPIDSKVWRAYGWRNLTVGRVCYASDLFVECGTIVGHVEALDSRVAEAPK